MVQQGWTTEPPTEPGWYWHDSGIVYVSRPQQQSGKYHVPARLQGKLSVGEWSDDGEEFFGELVTDMGGEWCGPLKPPE